VERDKQTVTRVHRFDDNGEEFARMVAGSMHPVALAAPCACGSGKAGRDCCSVE
jgi:uncharacterized protein YchJ